MKKIKLLKWGVLCLFCMLTTIGWAETVEQCLYSTDFTTWTETSTYSQEVKVTTEYSNESLVFTLDSAFVKPEYQCTNSSGKLNFDGTGMIEINEGKKGGGCVTTSVLNSITKVEVYYGTSGSNRGLDVYAKGDGDEDWVQVLSGVQSSTGGYTSTIEVNRENCQLKFVSAADDQYVYLVSLAIYGNVEEGGDVEEEDGVTAVTVYENADEAEALTYEASGGTLYFSFTIPSYEGTLTIDNGLDHLYTTSDCSGDGIEGTWVSGDIYKWSGLTPGEKYYASVNAKYFGGTITATYESSNEGSGITVNLDGDITTLSEGTVITISGEGLSEGAGIVLNIYDENDEWVYGGSWFDLTINDDGSYTGTYTWPLDTETAEMYGFSAGKTYTFKVSVYSVNERPSSTLLLDSYELFTFEVGDVAAIISSTLTTDPEIGGTITSNGEDQTITLTFDTDVIVTEAQINTGGQGAESHVNATIGEQEGASTTWTLTITADQLASVVENMDGNLTLMIYAEDADGNTVCDEDGTSFFQISYTVEQGGDNEEGEAAWTFTPASGDTVYGSLSTITVYNETGISVQTGTITVTKDGSPVDVTVTGENSESNSVEATITFEPALTEGTYTVTIPAGYFLLGDDDAVASPAAELSYTVSALEISIDESLKAILENESGYEDIEGTEIYVTSNVSGYMTWALNDQDGENVGSGYLEYQEGDDQYYLEWPAGITLYSGSEYTFTVTLYADETKAVEYGSADLFTIIGAAEKSEYSSINLLEITPNPDVAELSLDGAIITLTYSGAVKIDEENTYINMGQDNEPLALTINGVDADEAGYAETWQLTIDEETIAQFAGSVITINVVANDATGALVEGNEGDYSIYTYSVEAAPAVEYSLDYTPADGDTVESITTIQIVEANSQQVVMNGYESDIVVYDADGNQVTTGVDWSIDNPGNTLTDDNGNEIGYIIELEDAITTAGDYTIVIPEDFILYGGWDVAEEGNGNKEVTLNVTVTGNESNETGTFAIAVSQDEAEVEELTEFVITIEGEDITLNEDKLSEIELYARWVTTQPDATISEVSSEVVDGNTVYTLTLETPVTDVNSYQFTIPAGLFSDANGNTSEEYDGYVYVMGPTVTHEYTAEPEDGSTVEALESITIICEDGMWWSWIGEITATKDGEAYELNITEDDMVAGEDDGANGDPSRMTIYLNITEAGEYVITIPEGYFIVGSDAANSDEIVLTYTVEGETTGINGVTLKATDNDRFYNLNGQRVTSPRNGIFILNGKKVLVK